MMKSIMAAGCLAFMLLPAAHAQIIVGGEGDGHACYMSAKTGDTGRKSSIRVCERALSEGNLFGIDRAATHVNMGILLMRRESFIQALSAFDNAINIEPTLSEAYLNRGACLVFLERHQEAVEALTISIDLDTDYIAEALYNRALAYEPLEKLNLAYADLQRVKALRPDWDVLNKTLDRYQVVPN